MQFRTIVDIPQAPFQLAPCERMLFVGSCFAENIGRKATEAMFRTTVNPFGTMYNPASILHTVQRTLPQPSQGEGEIFSTAVFTLGTNHVYILKETGEIVDNCEKRPQRLFEERELTSDECANYLLKAVELLRSVNPDVRVIFTVSPIRYRKYGYHESQLSKAILLLAIDKLLTLNSSLSTLHYFPSYEIVLDELRDYRFYAPDMLHPSAQAVDYIWERFGETFFSDETRAFFREWEPLRAALAHRPFNPDSAEYKAFRAATLNKVEELRRRYPAMPNPFNIELHEPPLTPPL